jgi:hypothetical protein
LFCFCFVVVVAHSCCCLGESSFSAIVADDVTGDGLVELIVAGRSGDIFALATREPAVGTNRWPSAENGLSGGTLTTLEHRGVRLLTGRDSPWLHGSEIQVEFDIIDKGPRNPPPAVPTLDRYRITVTLSNASVELASNDVGRHVVTLQLPEFVSLPHARLSVVVEDWWGQRYDDSVSVSLNVGLERLFKWMLALPVAGLALLLALAERILPAQASG